MTNFFPSTVFSENFEISMKLVDLNLTKFTEIVEAQTAAAASFFEQATTGVKAASEIQHYDDVVEFINEQTKIVQSTMKNTFAEYKSSAEESIAYAKEVQQILNFSTIPAK